MKREGGAAVAAAGQRSSEGEGGRRGELPATRSPSIPRAKSPCLLARAMPSSSSSSTL